MRATGYSSGLGKYFLNAVLLVLVSLLLSSCAAIHKSQFVTDAEVASGNNGMLKWETGQPVNRVAFSRDNSIIVAAKKGGKVSGYSAVSRKMLWSFRADGEVDYIFRSSADSSMVVKTKKGSRYLFDPVTGKLRFSVKNAGEQALLLSSGHYVFARKNGTVEIRDSKNGNILNEFNVGSRVTGIDADVSKGIGFVITEAGKFVVFRVSDARVVYEREYHEELKSIAVSGSGNLLAIGGKNGSFSVIDLRSHTEVAKHKDAGYAVVWISFMDEDSLWWVGRGKDKDYFKKFSVASGRVTSRVSLQHDKDEYVRVKSDKLILFSWDKMGWIYDISSNIELGHLISEKIRDVSLTPDGRVAFVRTRVDCFVIRTEDGEVLSKLDPDLYPNAIAVSSDYRKIALAEGIKYTRNGMTVGRKGQLSLYPVEGKVIAYIEKEEREREARRLAEERRQEQLRIARQQQHEQERTVVLRSGQKRKGSYYKSPIKKVEQIVAAKEKAYVELKDKSFPPEIRKPSLPKPLNLTQGQYEADSIFSERVKEAQAKRQKEIKAIQDRYKTLVDVRNSKIEALQGLQQQRIDEIAEKREAFIASALEKVFQGVVVKNGRFNRKTAIVSFDVQAIGGRYSQRVGAELTDPKLIKRLVERPHTVRWEATFKGKEDSFVLDRVEGQNVTFKEMKADTLLASGERQSVTIGQGTGGTLASIAKLQKQAPDLADYNNTVTLRFNDGRTVRVSGDADLARQVAELKAGSADPKVYLLAIGIENYKSAAQVPFAENSLKVVAQLLSKKYGIPQKNQIILSGDAATGQAIQGNIRNLAARMGASDTLFFYYAGHGLAGRNGKKVYMLPSDAVRGAYVDDDFAFDNLITQHFSKMGRVYAFLDTCFSGRASSQTMLTQGVAPVYKTTPHTLPDNVTVFFAGQGDQFANYYQEKGHRLFSYYLARSILENKKDVKDIESFLKENVRAVSAKMGVDHLQEPFVGGNVDAPLGTRLQ